MAGSTVLMGVLSAVAIRIPGAVAVANGAGPVDIRAEHRDFREGAPILEDEGTRPRAGTTEDEASPEVTITAEAERSGSRVMVQVEAAITTEIALTTVAGDTMAVAAHTATGAAFTSGTMVIPVTTVTMVPTTATRI